MGTNVTQIEIYEDEQEGWRWRAKAANGEIVATGESHTTRHDAKRAARAVFPGVLFENEITEEKDRADG